MLVLHLSVVAFDVKTEEDKNLSPLFGEPVYAQLPIYCRWKVFEVWLES